jgi:hypothetical protein
MKTFKNKNFVTRDYDCTNIVACRAQAAPSEHFIEAPDFDLSRLTQLWTENGVTYFGHM